MPQGSSYQRPEAVTLRVYVLCTCCLGTWAGPQKCHLALAALRMTHTSVCSPASLQGHEAAHVALHDLPQGACVDACISAAAPPCNLVQLPCSLPQHSCFKTQWAGGEPLVNKSA